MKPVSVTIFAALLSVSTSTGWAEISAGQTQQAAFFKREVQALDPHSTASEPEFQSLVDKYVSAVGPIQDYLEFMMASGFQCPPITSLAYDQDDGSQIFRCTFEPDLGSAGEPNLSSIQEVSVFGVIAHGDANLMVAKVQSYMTHGLTGP